MPALKNPRHEAFARAIFIGLFQPDLHPTHGHAYNAAGYRAIGAGEPGGAAEVNACRLLKKAKILERVHELQAQAAEDTKETAEKCVQELNQLRKDAHSNKAYSAAVAAVMGKAKILNFITHGTETKPQDYASAQSMQDIGRMLLQSIGFKEPDDVSIRAAIELNDTFVDGLQAIYQRAQSLTLERA
jgi:hypothetical protein